MEPVPSSEVLSILSISPMDDDHACLSSIVGRSRWKLLQADCVSAATALLRSHDVSVVVCERDLMPGKWSDVLDAISELENPPSLIVTSRLADDRLWAEALNLGAWDVLAKPFERREVVRSVKGAWQHWYDQKHLAGMFHKVMRAAS